MNKDRLLKEAELSKQKTNKNMVIAGTVGLMIFSLISFVFYKRNRDAVQKQKDALLNQHVVEVELKALRSQISPHFIFNSLQSVYEYLQLNKTKEAADYLIRFSKLIRLMLSHSRHQMVPLDDDLKALELYMELEALRLEYPFTYHIHVDEEIRNHDLLFPPMLIQPFVENSIKHGFANMKNAGKLSVTINSSGDNLECIIEDDGTTVAQPGHENTFSKSESLGTKLVEERLLLAGRMRNYTPHISMNEIKDKTGIKTGFVVKLVIPFEMLN